MTCDVLARVACVESLNGRSDRPFNGSTFVSQMQS